MNQDLFAVGVAILVFLSGIAGLVYQAWDPKNEGVNETRDLINRLTGLVATLSALVLGLLIASANGFYNSQKTGLETVSARVLALDGVLRRYGPETQPARATLKELITGSYTHVWQGDNSTPRRRRSSWPRSGWIGCLSTSMPCERQRQTHGNT